MTVLVLSLAALAVVVLLAASARRSSRRAQEARARADAAFLRAATLSSSAPVPDAYRWHGSPYAR